MGQLIYILYMYRINSNSTITDRFPAARLSQPQRINPPHWIRRIREQVQPARVPDRILADKPPDPWIIVPIAVVVQPGLVVVVLALKAQRVGQALLFGFF